AGDRHEAVRSGETERVLVRMVIRLLPRLARLEVRMVPVEILRGEVQLVHHAPLVRRHSGAHDRRDWDPQAQAAEVRLHVAEVSALEIAGEAGAIVEAGLGPGRM